MSASVFRSVLILVQTDEIQLRWFLTEMLGFNFCRLRVKLVKPTMKDCECYSCSYLLTEVWSVGLWGFSLNQQFYFNLLAGHRREKVFSALLLKAA